MATTKKPIVESGMPDRKVAALPRQYRDPLDMQGLDSPTLRAIRDGHQHDLDTYPDTFEWQREQHLEIIERIEVELAKRIAEGHPETDRPTTKDGESLNKPLSALLTSWGIPESMHGEMAAELESIVKARASASRRPKWDERDKYAELKHLSAPQYLKRVYSDLIASDGAIEKQAIREIDPKLMASVEVYMSNRKKREQDAGDAAGLRLIAGPTSPHRQPTRRKV